MKINKAAISKKLQKMSALTDKSYGVLCGDGILAAYSGETYMLMECPEVTEPFILPVEAVGYINHLPNEDIEINSTAKGLTIKSSCGVCKFATKKADTFPAIPDIEGADDMFGMDGLAFIEAVERVIYAAGINSAKGFLNGVHFQSDGQVFDVVASDSYRLAWTKLKTPGRVEINATIPRFVLEKLLKLKCATVDIMQLDRRFVFKTDEYTLICPVLEGKYFDYKKAFDQKFEMTIDLKPSEIQNCLERLQIAMSSKLNRIGIERDGDRLAIHCRTETVSFEESVQANYTSDGEIKSWFNAIYFAEALRAIDTVGDVSMFYADSQKPVIILDGMTNHLVLPVKER